MRKIITITFLTLDGVMQAPGSSEEDKAEGFAYGGWQMPFTQDEMMDSVMDKFMNTPFELLLGKTTYNIFAGYWPTATTDNEVAVPFNSAKKYVVSHESFQPVWNNSICISGDIASDIVSELNKLKQEDGPDLWVWGSGNLIQTLLKYDLIDRMHIWTHPVTIGTGKRLFAEGTQAKKFKLIDSKISNNGVIFAIYEPAGELQTS